MMVVTYNLDICQENLLIGRTYLVRCRRRFVPMCRDALSACNVG
jgi:hypothetical protein